MGKEHSWGIKLKMAGCVIVHDEGLNSANIIIAALSVSNNQLSVLATANEETKTGKVAPSYLDPLLYVVGFHNLTGLLCLDSEMRTPP